MAINERQLELYNYLLNQETWVNRKDILRDLCGSYGYIENGDLYHNPSAVLLTRDINILNNSHDVRKLIISSSKHGVKIATKEEAKSFLMRNFAENIRRMQKYHFLQEKLYKDGQTTIEDKVIEAFRR
jgi:hypothetical protein